MKYKSLILFTVCAFSLSFARVEAQLTPENALNDLAQNVSIVINPNNPGPDTNVTITIESYATDLNQAKITWTLQGKTAKSETGGKTFLFKTGPVGYTTTVGLSINPSDGVPFTKTIVITPTTVDLMWQSLAYTPPFYKGRALLANHGSLIFLAIPKILDQKGNALDPKQMIYTWSKNGTVLGSLSGYGKNSLYVSNSLLNLPLTISVSVSDINNKITAQNSVYIKPIEPKILFYENNPLYGILYNNALADNFNLSNKEITIIGSPYYFSTSDFGGAINYNWSLNGSQVSGVNQNFITLRQQTGSGQSVLDLMIQNTNKLLQTTEKSMQIIFSDQNTL